VRTWLSICYVVSPIPNENFFERCASFYNSSPIVGDSTSSSALRAPRKQMLTFTFKGSGKLYVSSRYTLKLRLTMRNFIRVTDAAESMGLSASTLRRLCDDGHIQSYRTGGGHRMVSVNSINEWNGESDGDRDRLTALYARVSTGNESQKSSLISQQEKVSEWANDNCVDGSFFLLSDVGSGISFEREGFSSLLEQIFDGQIERVVVTHEDRFSRSGISTLKNLLARFECELLALEKKDATSLEEDLLAEISSALFVYGAKQYGKRASSKRKLIVLDKDLELIHKLADDGFTAKEIHRRCEDAGIVEQRQKKTLSYHWIAKEVSEHNVRRRAISEAQNESRWADESLKQFFVREMKKDSTGHARSFSRSIKERFELFCEKESFSVDKRHAYWWARLLKANGVGVAKEKRSMMILGWELR